MAGIGILAKLLVSATAVGATATVAGLGTFGTFTDTTSSLAPSESGIVNLDLGAVGATNRLTVAATDIVPGDTIQRAFTLSSATSTSPLGSVTMTSTASSSSLLDTDATLGLQMKIEKCSLAGGWTEAGTSPAFTYTCPAGAITSVLSTRAVIATAAAVTGLDSLVTAGTTDQLRMTVTFPPGAGNTFQDQLSLVSFRFDATQRTLTNS